MSIQRNIIIIIREIDITWEGDESLTLKQNRKISGATGWRDKGFCFDESESSIWLRSHIAGDKFIQLDLKLGTWILTLQSSMI